MKIRRDGLRAAIAMGLVLGMAGCGQRSARPDGAGETGVARSNSTEGDGGEASKGGGKAIFPEMEHDFGEVEQGESVTHVFKVRNEGQEVLHIGKVRGS